MVQVLNLSSVRVRQRNEARRTEILRAAARVFRRRGVAAAGMREIAEEAGLSPGNLYHYFSGKDEILLFCQERTLERMHAALQSARPGGRSAAHGCASTCTQVDDWRRAAPNWKSAAEAARADDRKGDAYERLCSPSSTPS